MKWTQQRGPHAAELRTRQPWASGLEPRAGTACALCPFPPGPEAALSPQLSCPADFVCLQKDLLPTGVSTNMRTHITSLLQLEFELHEKKIPAVSFLVLSKHENKATMGKAQ